jgi:hypothetical protein
MRIGIVGARKFHDRESVVDLVTNIPPGETFITSSSKGVCTWAREVAEERGIKVILFSSDLENIRSWFEVPKRYYQRNKELVEACDLLHAFISREDGFTGGTRFEVEHAVTLGIPVLVHWESGLSQWIFQHSFPFWQGKQGFLLSWEGFFHKIRFELGGQ